MKSSTEKSRSLSLDCTRIVAVLAVVMIHTAMDFIKFDISSSSYMWGNIFDSFARAGVPLFVMVSGALMLDEEKEISIKKVFSKYILNIIFLFISWSFIYLIPAMAKEMTQNETITLSYIIRNFVTGGIHMWYLIMIIGLYLIIPVLKLFVKKENSNKILYIIVVSVAFMFLPVLLTCLSNLNSVFDDLCKQLARFQYGFMGVFTTYFITGWYVINNDIKHKKVIYLLSLISVLIIIILVQVTGNYNDAYSNSNILVYLYSLGIFIFINDICKNKVSPHFIEKLSNMTFGVYIIHIIVLYVIKMFFDNAHITPLSILIRFSLITLISFMGTYIISKIPGLKKLVRF